MGRRSPEGLKRWRAPTYYSWLAMRARCRNPKHPHFRNYGGRGIQICERWGKYQNFLADMGERPSGTTLDRFPNNDGHYEPGNCRWATWAQQVVNRRQAAPRRLREAA